MNTPEDDEQLTFGDLGLDERVLQALSEVGYEFPSRIQAATIPALLAGRHVVGLAQTGTGKTAAFATPILSRLDPGRRPPQALVLAPTRELALQVCEAFARYAAHLPGVHVVPVYGGASFGAQLAGLRRGAHIVVGTPGRVIDHLNRGTLDLGQLRFLVLDEADEMLQMGFQEDVETILATTPDAKQVALFSATMPAQIRRMAARYLTDAQEITVREATVTAAATRQRYLLVAHQEKLDALTRVIETESFDAMIVFVRTKSATEDVAGRLRARGLSAAAINGDLAQAQRERAIGELRSGALDILVATDVAARGLDVERISHVVNYDIPQDSESYVHRIGRTGRAGRSGEALLFVTPRERHLLATIERATRQPIAEMPLPTADDVNTTRVARFADSITEHLARVEAGTGQDRTELATFRRLIRDYVTEHDVDVLDVAAALAVMTRDGSRFLLPPDPPRSPRRERKPATARVAGPRRPRDQAPMAGYRIEVGRRQKVQPGAIVGALANEGGLSRADFGHIDIRADHSIVELPEVLPEGTVEALAATRISGKLITMSRLDGPVEPRPTRRPGRPGRPSAQGRSASPASSGRKPRHRRPGTA
ncbi:MAG: DEAD/DEAH box helicase [Kineosporiaceae bacterium]|nr:DEAD/DEAH box helicase [Kineosporiaceae bacterium]